MSCSLPHRGSYVNIFMSPLKHMNEIKKIKYALFYLEEAYMGETQAKIWLEAVGLLNDKTKELLKKEDKTELINILNAKLDKLSKG